MDKVNQQSFDVRPVIILISHNHELSIPFKNCIKFTRILFNYLRSLMSSYFFAISNPKIFMIFYISSFLAIYELLASLTLSNFPFNGKTPNLSLALILDTPATARDLAESPSVRINVHKEEFLVPAKLASSNLGKPKIL